MKNSVSIYCLLAFYFIITSCENDDLPPGFHIKEGDRGKAWIINANKEIVLNDVKSVFKTRDGRVIAEIRNLKDTPSYGFEKCNYYNLKNDGINIDKIDYNIYSDSMYRKIILSPSSRSCIFK